MDRNARADLDDAAFFKQYAEAREKGVPIYPAAELMHRAAAALGARGARGLPAALHDRSVGFERDASLISLLARELRVRQGDHPDVAASCDALERAALLLGRTAESLAALEALSPRRAA